MTRHTTGLISGALLLFAAAACGEDAPSQSELDGGAVSAPICSAEELTEVLTAAQPGDVVVIGACEITGSFTIGADVTLQGVDATSSKIISEGTGVALNLEPGAGVSTIEDLTIASDGFAALSATQSGTGSILLRNLDIQVSQGGGIMVAGPALATIDSVQVRGNLGPNDPPPALPAGEEARSFSNSTYVGLIASGGRVILSDVLTSGFAMAGAAFIDADVTWTGGEACDTYQHGIYVSGGKASLTDVGVQRTMAIPGSQYNYGLVSFDGAQLETTRLTASNNEKFGVVQLAGTTGKYTDLSAEDNGAVALWVQSSNTVDIVGMNGFMSSNTMSGVVIRDTTTVSVQGLSIESTLTVPHVVGNSVFDVGDGMQIFDSFENLSVQNSSVSLNGRAGIVLQTSTGILPDGMFAGVTANSSDGALGVVAQSLTDVIPAGESWDQGVTREGDAATVDLTHSTRVVTSEEIVGMNGIIATPPQIASAAP